MAPKRVEDSIDELVEDNPQEFEFTEVQFPGIADGIALGPSKLDDDFNFQMGISTFRLASVQPQHATATPPRLQQLLHGINRTPPLAVQLNGCAWEGLCSLKS